MSVKFEINGEKSEKKMYTQLENIHGAILCGSICAPIDIFHRYTQSMYVKHFRSYCTAYLLHRYPIGRPR